MFFKTLKAFFIVFVILIAVPTALFFGLTKYQYQVTPELSKMEAWPTNIPRDEICQKIKLPLERGEGAVVLNELLNAKTDRAEINCIMSKTKYHLVQESVKEDGTIVDSWLVISVGFIRESTATIRLFYTKNGAFVEAK